MRLMPLKKLRKPRNLTQSQSMSSQMSLSSQSNPSLDNPPCWMSAGKDLHKIDVIQHFISLVSTDYLVTILTITTIRDGQYSQSQQSSGIFYEKEILHYFS